MKEIPIARCAVHGLHGARRDCFVCGEPVEQIPMIVSPTRRVQEALARGELPQVDPLHPSRVDGYLVQPCG